jgi:hypothetical protein
MRKRGLIVIGSAISILLFIVVWDVMTPHSAWDLRELGDPLYLGAAKLAAGAVIFFGFSLMIYDAAVWAAKRIHERHSQTN